MATSSIQPSKDTLFIRGFTTRHHVDEIRDFFTREAGHNSVEFFKDDGNNMLYVALRFESKYIAKEVLNRFDNVDVLGDRITMSWYKNLRGSWSGAGSNDFRGRQSNNRWHGDDQYDYRNSYNKRPPFTPKQRWPQVASSRPRRYTRSSSRSRSRSASRSPSARSYSRSRSTSASFDSRERSDRKKHSFSDSSNRHKSSWKRKTTTTTSSKRRSPTPDQTQESSPPSEATTEQRTSKKKERNKAETDHTMTTPSVGGDQNNDTLETSSPSTSAKMPRPEVVVAKEKPKKGHSKKAESDEQAVLGSSLGTTSKKTFATNEKISKVEQHQQQRQINEEISEDDDAEEDEEAEHTGKKTEMPQTKKAAKDYVSAEITDKQQRGQRQLPSKLKSSNISEVYDKAEVMGHDDVEEADRHDDMEFDDDEDPLETNGIKRNRILNNSSSALQDSRSTRRPAPYGNVASSLSSAIRRQNVDNNGSNVVTNRGALGLSQEKMALIRDKKEEIEKAYRQDCETFATVTKLLIRKDPDLEEKIQGSLRDNLKEIGQRCLQELRDFVDRLKSEDDQ